MESTPGPSSMPDVKPEDDTYPQPPQNVDSAPFRVLVGLFEKLQNERKQDKRMRHLHTWFNHWREQVGNDLYPVLRLILPQKDRERAVYGLKEANIANAYIKLIPLSKKDHDAVRLKNWKKPNNRDKNQSAGDFPTVLYEVVQQRSSVLEGTLTIQELNNLLDELCKSSGNQDTRLRVLQRMYNSTTANEQRWIARIILKDLVISVKENTVFQVFHPDAQDLFNTCSDLKKVAWTLWDPSFRLHARDKNVRLFQPFAPMLCTKPMKTIERTVKEMGGVEFMIEEKLDGERMQVHKRGNRYCYWSRKGKDYTYLYGENPDTGTLTPYLHKAFHENVEEIILDGEMLVWDPVSERNLPFGTLKTAAGEKSNKQYSPRPCFKVFDLLYINGISALDRSLSFRKRNMRAYIKEIKGRVEYATQSTGKDAKAIRDKMEEIMEKQGEGLVIKHPMSKYILNGRNKDWIKVKPEYMDGMSETVDVLVVGGNYGTGHRAGGVSTLVCAVLDDRSSDDNEEPKYSTFVRIGTGLTFMDYAWIRKLPWKELDLKNPPSWLQFAAKGRHEDKSDLYLEPQESFILKVKAAGITLTDQYHVGYTMRFPRALGAREDKGAEDCMTFKEVLESVKSEKKRKIDRDSATGTAEKKRKTTTKKPMVIGNRTNLKGVEVTSDILHGMKFMVLADPKLPGNSGEEERTRIYRLIRAHGGGIAQQKPTMHDPDFFVIYGGTKMFYNLRLIIEEGLYDVLNSNWITDSIKSKEKVPMRRKYFFHATESRKESEEYGEGDDDETEDGDRYTGTEKANSEADLSLKQEEIDPKLTGWLANDLPEKADAHEQDSATESETEYDSDGQDFVDQQEQEGFNGDELGDEWSEVGQQSVQTQKLDVEDIKMGEDDQVMEYDTELIFKHLCFYIDSPNNAHQHGMSVKTKCDEKAIDQSLNDVGETIKKYGGRIVDLNEPKLTHIVMDKRDVSRRRELRKRTSEPKYRHLILSSWVDSCVEMHTLINEEGK
ncbi:ATP-dependent DNA ligase [Dendrothele bispora CBS 962.96]|uniref:DNA ligase n=1 Tax=Dendrothele bispora (strain CBS 962.96) TaxID=1314807 RepID=A0A4S8M9M1_DENBC|nr:ATP-dependent DNA ligase [Dendrothele bispora CBS 962.96]